VAPAHGHDGDVRAAVDLGTAAAAQAPAGCKVLWFGEGPLDLPAAALTLCAERRRDRPVIRTYDRATDTIATWWTPPSGTANGVALLLDGRLAVCLRDRKSVVALDPVGPAAPPGTLIDNYRGRRFNAPTDLVADAGGGLYFADPPLGPNESTWALAWSGAYVLRAGGDGRTVELLDATLPLPDGVGLLSDGGAVVGNSRPASWTVFRRTRASRRPGHAPASPRWAKQPVASPPLDALLPHVTPVLPPAARGGVDGLAVDGGRVYASGYEGLHVMVPDAGGGAGWDVRCILPLPPNVPTYTSVAVAPCGTCGRTRCLWLTAPKALYRLHLAD